MKGIFITGTDTGVGKTYVATRIARELVARGVHVVPRKPVESGCPRENGILIPQDALALKIAAACSDDLNQVCPYAFEPAISPARAAQLVNKQIFIRDLKSACLDGVTKTDFLLVEGAGGFYSPLCSDGLNADLAQALHLPLVLVTEDRVGCINHCLLTLAAAQQRGMTILAILLSRKNPAASGMDNLRELTQHIRIPVFYVDANLPAQFITLLPQAC